VQREKHPLTFQKDRIAIIHPPHIAIWEIIFVQKQKAPVRRRIVLFYYAIVASKYISIKHYLPGATLHSSHFSPDISRAALFYLNFPVQSHLAIVLYCWYYSTHSFL